MPLDIKLANVVKDQDLMEEARKQASRIIAEDPQENLPQYSSVWSHLSQLKKHQINFSAIS